VVVDESGRGGGLEPLFAPRSVAVVGVSRDPGSLGRRALRHLLAHGFAGEVHVVHPSFEGEIEGNATVRSIAAIEPAPDLAFVCAGGDKVLPILTEAVAAGVGALAVIAASGAIVEQRDEVRALLDGTGVRLLGPNMPGFLSVRPPVAPHISNFVSRERLDPAPIGVIAQSGAVGGVIGELLSEAGVGLDWLISTGNEFDLALGECLEFLAERKLRAIGLFVESVRDPDAFRRGLARAAERGVAVLATKVGRSAAGERQAMTHTGALTGDSALFERELARHGGALCDDLEELAARLAVVTLPRPRRRSVAVAAASGGLAGLIGDLAVSRGLPVPDLGGENLSNPWDTDVEIVDDPPGAVAYWRRVLDQEEVGSGILGFGSFPEAQLQAVADELTAAPVEVPLVLCAAAGMPAAVRESLRGTAVSLGSPRVAVAALEWWTRGAPGVAEGTGTGDSRSPGPAALDEAEAKRRLAASGVAVPWSAAAESAAEAATLAGEREGPVVLKCLRPALLHKATAGGVALNLRGPEEVERAWTEMAVAIQAATGEPMTAALLEQQLPAGLELIASADTDPDYGPFLTVGAGGGEVERDPDVTHILLSPNPADPPVECHPLVHSRQGGVDPEAISEALSGLRIAGALRQAAVHRGEDGAAPAALVRLLEGIAAAAAENRAGVEVNPVILPLGAGDPVAADCVMTPHD
jgi:acetate---CoA ligase (ADP-forming)